MWHLRVRVSGFEITGNIASSDSDTCEFPQFGSESNGRAGRSQGSRESGHLLKGASKLHFGMKSRLLPTPEHDERESQAAAPTPQRRESDVVNTFDEVEAAVAVELKSDSTIENPQPSARPAPPVSPRPNGRYLVVAILLACVVSVGYSLWSTFLRDAAYGVVTGRVTTLSPAWSGTLTAVYAKAGDTVRQGDVLAIVHDPELQDQIDRLGDDLRSAQAELDAQAALLAVAARQRDDDAAELRSQYFELRGELLSEQSRLTELDSKLTRRQELANQRAYSEEEIEAITFQCQGLTEKIENLQQSVDALKSRVDSLPDNDNVSSQLKPWLAKIDSARAELVRLREKHRRGTLTAPFHGTVVEVVGHVGERMADDQPLLELLPSDALELILYVEQADAADYRVGRQLQVVVEPNEEPIVCEVSRIGARLEKPQAHVVGRYRPEEKLLPIILKPTQKISADQLRLGSTIRLPFTFFDSTD